MHRHRKRLVKAISGLGGQAHQQYPREMRRRVARSIMRPIKAYPRQYEMVQAIASQQLSCEQANRRGGKTRGIASLIESRVIARDNYTVRILCHERATPSDTWLDCRPQESFLLRLQRHGLFDERWVTRSAGKIAAIRFPWGSAIYVHSFNQPVSSDRRHGFQAHFYWADEAQSIEYLEAVLSELVLPTLAENDAQVCVSGTPGKEIGGYFYRLAHDPTWSVPRVYGFDNVIFGDTDAQRWSKIVNTILRPARATYYLADADLAKIQALTREQRVQAANGNLAADHKKWFETLHPRLRRQYFGAWVAAYDEYVFEWHRSKDLHWLRDPTSPWHPEVPIAAETITGRVQQLPKKRAVGRDIMYQWHAAIGCDLGWNDRGTAIVVMVWAVNGERAYVLWTEAHTHQPDDETRDRLVAIVRELRLSGVIVHGVKADVNGMRKGTGAQWDNDLRAEFGHDINAWIHEPRKHDKEQQIRALNFQLRRGMWQFVAGDELDIAGRFLKFKPQKPDDDRQPKIWKKRQVELDDGRTVVPGDHTLDSWRYGAQLVPLLKAAKTPVPVGVDEWLFREQQALDRMDGLTDRMAI
jgi:hypothetical protein